MNAPENIAMKRLILFRNKFREIFGLWPTRAVVGEIVWNGLMIQNNPEDLQLICGMRVERGAKWSYHPQQINCFRDGKYCLSRGDDIVAISDSIEVFDRGASEVSK